MDFNLKMLNLWIGLCKADKGLPSSFHALGYQQHAIEQKIRNTDGSLCVPEFIAFSKRSAHTILFEWKSGNNTEADQLARYAKLTTRTLIDVALVDKTAASSFDVAVVCQASNAERIKMGISQGEYKFPVLAVSDDGISLVLNQFCSTPLNKLFLPMLRVDMKTAPVSHVPVSDTSEDWEVVNRIIPLLLEKMLVRATIVKASSLCPLVFSVWDNMASDARRAAQRRICQLLEQATISEFHSFWSYKRLNDDCQIDILHNPVSLHDTKRSGAYKRLLGAAKQFKTRLAEGKRFDPDPQLFD